MMSIKRLIVRTGLGNWCAAGFAVFTSERNWSTVVGLVLMDTAEPTVLIVGKGKPDKRNVSRR